MKIRDIEVDFNFLDADDVERFEKEAKKVQEECNIINNFFDKIFGEGISLKMFNGKNNLEDHIKAFEDIINKKMEKQKDLQNTFDRYQPNREQRRYKKYKGRK